MAVNLTEYRRERQSLSRLLGSPWSELGIKPRQLRHRIIGHMAAMTGIDLSSDESLIYASNRSGTVQVFSRTTTECVREFGGHQGWVSDVAVNAYGLVASAGSDHSVRLWDSSGRCLGVLDGHMDVVTSVAFNPSGNLLASASRDCTIKMWSIRKKTARLLRTLVGHKNWILSVCFADDAHVVSGGIDGAFLWEARKGRILGSYTELPSVTAHLSIQTPFDFVNDYHVSVLKVHCRGDYAVTGSSDYHARIWDLKSGRLVRKINGVGGAAFSVQLGHDCRTVATGWKRRDLRFRSPKGFLARLLADRSHGLAARYGVHS